MRPRPRLRLPVSVGGGQGRYGPTGINLGGRGNHDRGDTESGNSSAETRSPRSVRFGVVPICGVLFEHGCKIGPADLPLHLIRPQSKRALSDTAVTSVLACYDEPDEHGRKKPESL